LRLVLDELGDATIELAGALIAGEHAVARRGRPELPASFDHADACSAVLQRLLDDGHHGVVATHQGRPVAVMTAIVREGPAVGRYARLPAEGFAVDPQLADPTTVLAIVYGQLAQPLIAAGVSRHYLLHAALPRLSEAVANLGFGRDGVYGVQQITPRPVHDHVAVRIADADDLDVAARLALVEIQHRAAPPMFGPPYAPPLDDLLAEQRALRDNGAVHLIAAVDGADVGLLTIELSTPVPRLCPARQPYIGPTVTLPEARRRGVGRALVDAALNWTHQHGYQWISVDFEAANPMSRPFWLEAGFQPTGYGVLRLIDQAPVDSTADRDQ
jgi:GNAT superfamily N-acetyltransferase